MNGRGPVLDRPLEPAWLDAALRISLAASTPEEARALIHVALGDAGLGGTARVKTATALMRVWIAAPGANAAPIEWSRRELSGEPDLRAIHYGALLAAYPFFGDVCSIVGRMLSLEDRVGTPEVRARMRALWGDRRTIHNAVQRAVKTLRALGVLTGAPGTSISHRGARLPVPAHAGRWIVHTLLLTRGIDAIDERDARSAPELFGLELPDYAANGYELLERHREGGERVVLARR